MSTVELLLLENKAGEISGKSLSHGTDHVDAVLKYAAWLNGIYGGDWEIIAAAAMTHDLGRDNRSLHGEASRLESMRMTRLLLDECRFPPEKIEPVLKCILDHDRPEVSPALVEGRILKDADFLAGVGAVGIVRIILWTAESDQETFVSSLLFRLTEKMPRRIESMEFPESRELARERYALVRLFVEQFGKETERDGGKRGV